MLRTMETEWTIHRRIFPPKRYCSYEHQKVLFILDADQIVEYYAFTILLTELKIKYFFIQIVGLLFLTLIPNPFAGSTTCIVTELFDRFNKVRTRKKSPQLFKNASEMVKLQFFMMLCPSIVVLIPC